MAPRRGPHGAKTACGRKKELFSQVAASPPSVAVRLAGGGDAHAKGKTMIIIDRVVRRHNHLPPPLHCPNMLREQHRQSTSQQRETRAYCVLQMAPGCRALLASHVVIKKPRKVRTVSTLVVLFPRPVSLSVPLHHLHQRISGEEAGDPCPLARPQQAALSHSTGLTHHCFMDDSFWTTLLRGWPTPSRLCHLKHNTKRQASPACGARTGSREHAWRWYPWRRLQPAER